VTSSSVAIFTCFHYLNDAGAEFVLADTDTLGTLWAERPVKSTVPVADISYLKTVAPYLHLFEVSL
jgi:hypothetical protein